MPLYHSILSGIALGDSKTSTAFKRANVSADVGFKAINELIQTGIITKEKGKKHFTSWDEHEKIVDKLFFNSPFLRFWFAFVSPIFKGIRDGDYKEIEERFNNRQAEFYPLIFTQLSHYLVKSYFDNDPIKNIRSYWDKEIELDIYGETSSGKQIVGITKYSNAKMKKTALSELQERCKKSNIKADIFVLVSKNGFSNELKSLKSENLKLLSLKNFKKLVNNG